MHLVSLHFLQRLYVVLIQIEALSSHHELRVHMYTSTAPSRMFPCTLHTMMLLLLPSAAVVSGMLASSYPCLLSQRAVVYGRQNMSCSHQPHTPPGPPQF